MAPAEIQELRKSLYEYVPSLPVATFACVNFGLLTEGYI